MYFDFLFLGESELSEGNDDLDGYTYLLVMLEEVSGYMWLAPPKAYAPWS